MNYLKIYWKQGLTILHIVITITLLLCVISLFFANYTLRFQSPVVVKQKIASQSASLIPKAYAAQATDIDPATVDMFDIEQVKAYVKQETIKEFGADQWDAMEALLEGESGFFPYARNASSGALGLFQALPASKYGAKGLELHNQVAWGLEYIKSTYQNPSNAYRMWLRRSPHWY